MTETNAAGTDLGLTTRLARTRFAVRAAMVVERGWPLVLPLLLVAVLFLSLSWLGVFRVLPDLVRLAVVVGFGIAALASLYPLRFYRHPTSGEIDRRIEHGELFVTLRGAEPVAFGIAERFTTSRSTMMSCFGFEGGTPVGEMVPMRAERNVTNQRPVSICWPAATDGVSGGWAAS